MSVEDFKREMKEKEDAAFALLRKQTDIIMHDEKAFKTFLNMQADHIATSIGNTLLVQAQMPDAVAVNSIQEWDKRNVPVRRDKNNYYPSGIYQFTPDGQYVDPKTKEVRTKFKIYKGYDASQTVNPDYAQAIMNHERPISVFVGTKEPNKVRNLALCDSSPIKCLLYDEKKLINDAEYISEREGLKYIPETKTIIIRKVARGDWFQRVAYEIALGLYHKVDGSEFDRSVRSFEAGVVAYMLCRMSGVDTSTFRFDLSKLPAKYPNQAEFRAMLNECYENAHNLSHRLNQKIVERNGKYQTHGEAVRFEKEVI